MVNSKLRKLFFVSPIDNGAQVVTSKQLLRTLSQNVNNNQKSSPLARVAKLVFFDVENSSSKSQLKIFKSTSKKIGLRKQTRGFWV